MTLKSDVICISEIYLNSDTCNRDANLEIVGYSIIRADHPSNRLLDIHYLEKGKNFENHLEIENLASFILFACSTECCLQNVC